MQKLVKGSDNGYSVRDTGKGWYYVFISDEKANECRSYEYSDGCGTVEEVEKELEKYNYKEIVERYDDQCVYCECIEKLY